MKGEFTIAAHNLLKDAIYQHPRPNGRSNDLYLSTKEEFKGTAPISWDENRRSEGVRSLFDKLRVVRHGDHGFPDFAVISPLNNFDERKKLGPDAYNAYHEFATEHDITAELICTVEESNIILNARDVEKLNFMIERGMGTNAGYPVPTYFKKVNKYAHFERTN